MKPVILMYEDGDPKFMQHVIEAVASGRRILPIPPTLGPNSTLKIRLGLSSKPPSDSETEGGLLFMTSGSTGAAKLVMRSWESLEEESESIRSGLPIGKNDIVLVTTPLAHSFGFAIAKATMDAGAILVSPGFDIPTLHRTLRDSPTIVTGVPFVFKALLRGMVPDGRLEDTRCYAGGEPMPASLPVRWEQVAGTPLLQEYGLSEVGVCSFSTPNSSPFSVGLPLPGVTFTLNLGGDESGELWSKRSHSPTSYYFGESPESFGSWGVRTGDIFTEARDGYHFVGRTKNFINVAGLKVQPSEIESYVRAYPGIDEVAVVGEPHELRGEIPVAYITIGYAVNVHSLKTYLRERLESHKIPRVRVVDELPRTPTGKVDRAALGGMS